MNLKARPLWELDEDVTQCRLCDTQFNFWKRRHHCRVCGKVICGFCSLSRILLPHLGYLDQQRVCDVCAKDFIVSKRRLAATWIILLSKPEMKKELRAKILKGIPSIVRPIIWQYMCDVSIVMAKNSGVYTTLLSIANDNLDEMLTYDVPRTFSEVSYFEQGTGQERLRNVLRAYGNFSSYAQYMTYIVGVLIMHMDDEKSFWVFVQMMKRYDLENIFRARDAFNLSYAKILERNLPDLYHHCKCQDLELELFVMPWIQTLFSQHFELDLVFRLWDIFFTNGFSIMINFTVALLKSFEASMLSLYGLDLIKRIQWIPSNIDNIDALFVAASKIKHIELDFLSTDEDHVTYRLN